MSVVEIIKHYQRSIDKCAGNEERILHCITKLYHLPITVQHLQETGIGRTVNSLRKYDGECGDAAKACVAKWKAVVAAEESSDGEPEEQPEPVEETEPVIKVKHRVEHQSSKPKPKEEDHTSSRRIKDEIKQKIKEGNGIVNKSRHETNYSESHSLHTDREVVSHKNKAPVESRDHKKHRGDKADSSSSESSPKKVKTNSETHRKHKEDKYVSSKPSSSSSGKQKLEAKENREDSGKKRKEYTEHSGQTSSRSNNDSKHQSSSSQKHSDDRSSEKKHREESRHKKVSSKKSIPEERTKSKKSDEEAVGNKNKKRSRVMAEVSDDSSDDASMELTKLNDKTKSRKNNSSPTFSPFNNSPTADGSIDCLSGASFAEALGMISPAKRRPSPNTTHKTSSKSSSSLGTPSKKKPTSSPLEFDFLSTSSPDLKFEASDIELPDINPNYRPLPNPYNPFDSPPSKKCSLAEDAVLEHLMSKNSTKTQRMKVFSGVKTSGSWKSVPSLFDICVRVLQENIDALEYTGGIPYDILKPVLKHASPDQLFMLEHYNPYLLEDTDSLWSYHINRHFKSKQRLEMETAREMYMRCLDEREAKFNTLRQSIKESQAKSVPVRQTKMAYVDNNYVKPPRNVARQQARNGVSGRIVPKGVPSSPASAAPSRPSSSSSSLSSGGKQKPRIAPLMQKTMKFAKTFKR